MLQGRQKVIRVQREEAHIIVELGAFLEHQPDG
jgi:hypothetical protein